MTSIRTTVVRAFGWSAGTLAVLAFSAFGIGACAFAAPPYTGPDMDNFDGKHFRNQAPVPDHGFTDVMKWMFTRDAGEWSRVDSEPGPAPVERVDDLRVTWVNHSTVLIQMNGINILTDPIWSERASPVSFAGPRRYIEPGIRFEDLPPISVVLISHNHYDHLDVETLQRLAKEHQPRIYTGLGNRAFLRKKGIDGATELNWWQSVDIGDGLRLTFVPAQHFSGRGLGDRNRTLWGGFVIESPGGAVYFAGDTGWGPQFQQIADRFSPIRLAILPIGAYQPQWFMSPVHINPEEALKAQRVLGAEYGMAIHFGTFPLADDGQNDPLLDLNLAHSVVPVPRERFWVFTAGESRDVPSIQQSGDVLARVRRDATSR